MNKEIYMMNNRELMSVFCGEKLKDYSIEDVFGMEESELKFHKLTEKQITQIQACKEMFKRLSKVSCIKEESLSNPGKIVDWIRFNIGFKDGEEFYVIYLNAAGSVIKSEVLFTGCKNASVVGVDKVMREAIMLKASAFVVCHNHPSGNVQPSFADKKITSDLKAAGEIFSIKLLDHIIVSKDNHFSFLSEGIL